MATLAAPPDPGIASALRRLYFARFAFAAVWAALFVATASDLNPVSVTLLVLYPLFDVAAALVDVRSSHSPALYLNLAISLLTAVGLAIACASGVPAVLRVWGAWAILAGLVQLVVGLSRRRLGGQWAMIASGGISVLAGTSFIVQAGGDDAAVRGVAGYALFGGILFLISALRLGRAARAA